MSTEELLAGVRQSTEFFAGRLRGLSDASLDDDSLLPGWSRRHVVAHIGFNAEAIGRLVAWAATGVESEMYASAEARTADINTGATLGPGALRDLFERSAAALDRAWIELPEASWAYPVRNNKGHVVPVSDTVWMRARELWVHAVDLDAGARFTDLPAPILNRLLGDVTDAWHARGADSGLLLQVSDVPGAALGDTDAPHPEIVSGRLADLTAWACGRSVAGVTSSTRDRPVAPVWM